MRLRRAVAAAVLAGAIGSIAAAPPLVGTTAPAIVLPYIANGSGTFDLMKDRGHPVYVNFFSSWCKPCKAEASVIEQAAREVSPETVIIGIAVLDTRTDALRFVRSNRLTYPIVFDETGKVGAAYRLTQLPLHVFIGRNGRVRQYVPAGPITAPELRAGLRDIDH